MSKILFNHYSYFFKKDSSSFIIFDENENILFYSGEKDFDRTKYFRIYSDQNQSQELLSYQKNKEGFWEIKDSETKKIIGFIEDSLLEWKILLPDKQKMAFIRNTILNAIIEILLAPSPRNILWPFFLLDNYRYSLLSQIVPKKKISMVLTSYNKEIVKIRETNREVISKCPGIIKIIRIVSEYNMLVEPQSFVDKKLVIAAGVLFIRTKLF